MNRFNISGRRPGGDYVSVLNIDRPDDVGIYQLEPIAYLAGSGNRELYLHGFDVEIVNETQLRFWMINHQPPAEEEDNGRTLADAYRLGANSTIEIFDCVRGGIEMHHVQTMADKAVDTPNNLAITGHEGVLVINDHSGKGKRTSLLTRTQST